MKQKIVDYLDFAIVAIVISAVSITITRIGFEFFAPNGVMYGVSAGKYATDTYYIKNWLIHYLATGFPHIVTIFLSLALILRVFTANLIVNFGLPLLFIFAYSFFWNIPSSAKTFVLVIIFFTALYFIFIASFLALRIFIASAPIIRLLVYVLTLIMITPIVIKFLAIHTDTYLYIRNIKPLFICMLYTPKILAIVLFIIIVLSVRFCIAKIALICKEIKLSKFDIQDDYSFNVVVNKLVNDKMIPQDIINILAKLKV